jgi:hypothetical protein
MLRCFTNLIIKPSCEHIKIQLQCYISQLQQHTIIQVYILLLDYAPATCKNSVMGNLGSMLGLVHFSRRRRELAHASCEVRVDQLYVFDLREPAASRRA